MSTETPEPPEDRPDEYLGDGDQPAEGAAFPQVASGWLGSWLGRMFGKEQP